MSIHKTAIIEEGAIIGQDVSIGPYAVIEKKVRLGKGSSVGAHVHIKGNTQIGENTFIGTGALVGEMPQMLGLKENVGSLYIGNNNIIREYVTIHTSTGADKATRIGNGNFLMGFSHVAHDCQLRNSIVLCNGSLLAGHIEVGDGAFISGNVVCHQFIRIGRLAMVAGLARVNQDVPPFMMVVGDSRVWGANSVGLRRAQFSREEIGSVKKAFNILYRKNLPLKTALAELKSTDSERVQEIVDFISNSKRGICGPNKSTLFEKIFLDYPYFLRTKIPTYKLFLKNKM